MPSFFRKSPAGERVAIPKESILILQGQSDGMPEMRFVNAALDDIAGSEALPYHLSIIIEMAETVPNGFPTPEETQVLKDFAKEVRANLEADENSALLASITWNGTRQLVYRVRDPEAARAYLDTLVNDPAPIRPCEIVMEDDPSWRLAEQYLKPTRDFRAKR
jgi:Family of unknown function (DUF695)